MTQTAVRQAMGNYRAGDAPPQAAADVPWHGG